MSARPVWIDLANSPHVHFFRPVIDELHAHGVPTVVTARDFAQTVRLAQTLAIGVEVIGAHGGASIAGKVADLCSRVRLLQSYAKRVTPSVAVSHNSYAQAVAGRLAGLPVVTAMDYEFQPANHLAFRCACLIAVPEAFPLDQLRLQGASPRRTWRYSGLKEDIALAGFVPDPGYLEVAGIDVSRPVVVVRPPADMALYHRFENSLFPALLRRLQRDHGLTVVTLPRTPGQREALESAGFGDLLWRGDVLDGRQLAAGADAVVSAGGSMIREAAALGTPAYSIYAGRLGAVDRTLVADGRLHLVRSIDDVDALRFERKPPRAVRRVGDDLVRQFVDRIMEVAVK